MRAAIVALRSQHLARIVVAVGVAPPDTYTDLAVQVDELVCLLQPEPFLAVGSWFEHFDSTSDEEVCRLLKSSFEREVFTTYGG